MLKPNACWWLRALAVFTVVGLVGCEKPHTEQVDPGGSTRRVVQGMQVTVYELEQGGERWLELAIAVDGGRTFRMPVFFTENGEITAVSTETAARRVDAWLKQRAMSVATLSTLGLQDGQKSPYITISEKPGGR
ncbi:hypothetical protein [Pseudomonas reactans]|uniref:hypothetical protein n=1 Tax=Pseudomonas reactans TaxID=117680 RepID=UPI0015A1F720|nr:hypothetical protein [Pseudomonas reactans]NWC90003.1 hypothetical protein [Pseudomonas reactans]